MSTHRHILMMRFTHMFSGGECPEEYASCDKETTNSCFREGADHCRPDRRPFWMRENITIQLRDEKHHSVICDGRRMNPWNTHTHASWRARPPLALRVSSLGGHRRSDAASMQLMHAHLWCSSNAMNPPNDETQTNCV